MKKYDIELAALQNISPAERQQLITAVPFVERRIALIRKTIFGCGL